jgi:hypothetical protein
MLDSPPSPNPNATDWFRLLLRPIVWIPGFSIGLLLVFLAVWIYQPNNVLRIGVGDDEDSEGSVNETAADRLSPEQWAFAADIDDLDVLLEQIEQTPFNTNTANPPLNTSEAPELPQLNLPSAFPDLDAETPVGLFADFGSSNVTSPSTPGFLGIDPLNANQITSGAELPNQVSGSLGNSNSQTSTSPLQQALDNLNQNPGQNPGIPAQQSRFGIPKTSMPTVAPQEQLSPNSNVGNNPSNNLGNSLNSGIPNSNTTNPNLINPNLINPSGVNPAYSPPINTGLSNPINYSSQNNSNSGIVAGQTVAPSPPTTTIPAPPSLGNIVNSNPGLESIQPSFPGASQVPQFPPSSTVSSPTTLLQPVAPVAPVAPFSTPRQAPGQYIGNGEINTFSNP